MSAVVEIVECPSAFETVICGDQHAEYTKALVYFISGRKDMNLEMITVERPDEVLVADYIYPTGTKPDKKA